MQAITTSCSPRGNAAACPGGTGTGVSVLKCFGARVATSCYTGPVQPSSNFSFLLLLFVVAAEFLLFFSFILNGTPYPLVPFVFALLLLPFPLPPSFHSFPRVSFPLPILVLLMTTRWRDQYHNNNKSRAEVFLLSCQCILGDDSLSNHIHLSSTGCSLDFILGSELRISKIKC